MKKRYVLIPAYKPEETLLSFIQALEERNLNVIVVNDGSGEEYLPLFQKMEDHTGVKLIQLEQNQGKGAALKAGLSYLQTLDGNFQIITVDADGQHSLQDTLFLLEEGEEHENCLLLGSRTQSGSSPLRSRLGNAITRKVFSLTTGVPVRDTQTGLRCFGKELIPDLLAIPGNRYEYEMNVLLEFARAGIPILEYPIETIYLNDNAGSHFDTVKDSFRIYGQILKFISTSLLSFLLDFLLYSLCFAYTGQIFLSNAIARILSLHANFFLNKNFVFASRAHRRFRRYARQDPRSVQRLYFLPGAGALSLPHQQPAAKRYCKQPECQRLFCKNPDGTGIVSLFLLCAEESDF